MRNEDAMRLIPSIMAVIRSKSFSEMRFKSLKAKGYWPNQAIWTRDLVGADIVTVAIAKRSLNGDDFFINRRVLQIGTENHRAPHKCFLFALADEWDTREDLSDFSFVKIDAGKAVLDSLAQEPLNQGKKDYGPYWIVDSDFRPVRNGNRHNRRFDDEDAPI